jgi:hypothetical protein
MTNESWQKIELLFARIQEETGAVKLSLLMELKAEVALFQNATQQKIDLKSRPDGAVEV